MANDTSTGYSTNWNQDNLPGSRLITFSPIMYPFLSRITKPVKASKSTEFAMTAQYALETDAQTAITEAEAVAGQTAITYNLTNETNYIQILQQAVNISDLSASSQDRLVISEVGSSGLGYTASPNQSGRGALLPHHLTLAQQQLYGTLEYSALNGTKTNATTASVAALMGGILKSVSTATVDGSTGDLTKAMIDELMLEMQTAGAKFANPVIFCNGFQKQNLSKIFGYQPASLDSGGVAIDVLRTDFGVWEIIVSKRIPTDDILFADMEEVSLVTLPVPGSSYMPDGLFRYNEKEKAGASEGGELYAQLSVDFGSEKMHGSVTNLSTS